MAYKLIISKDAHADLNDIVRYISFELKSVQAATTFLDDVEESYNRLAVNPFVYAKCSDPLLERREYRKIIIKNYLILFRVEEDNQAVYIVRIVYGGRNYVDML